MNNSRPQHSKEKGQSLVELAISLTFLIILVGGIFDLGMMFYTYVALRDTTQEGAIFASYNPLATSDIINRIHKSASYPIDATQITDIDVTCDGAPCVSTTYKSCQGQKITVEVVYNHEFIMPMISTLTGRQNIDLKTTLTSTILESPDTIEYLEGLSPPQACP